jgi:autotransporter-associated beta strand protein
VRLAGGAGNTFGGNINVLTNGKLWEYTTGDQIPDAVNVSVDGKFYLHTGITDTVAGLSGSGQVLASTGAATLTVGGNNATGYTFTGALVNVSGGTLSLTKTGTGTQTLSGASTYTGDTLINAGTLQFNAGGSANNSAIRIGLNSGSADATLALGSGVTLSSAWVSRDTGTGLRTIASLATSGTATLSGLGYMDKPLTTVSAAGGTLAFTGVSVDIKGNTLTVSGDGNTSISSIMKNDTGTGSLTKTGNGTLTLSGINTYSGVTTISGGRVVVTSTGKLGGATDVDVAVANGATLELQTTGSGGMQTGSVVRLNGTTGKATLGSGVTQTVKELYLGGVRKWAGTWGGTASADNIDTGRFSGTGYLVVTTGAPHPATLLEFR